MSEKLCVFCEHLTEACVNPEDGYYVGDGANSTAKIGCGKNHWTFSISCATNKLDRPLLAECIQTAKTCPDYKQVSP